MSDNNEPAVVPRPPAIQGGASVTPVPPQIAPAVAQWDVDAKAKTATADLLGGRAVISRSPKNGNYMCEFVRDITIEGEDGPQTGAVQLNFGLNDCTNLKMAMLRAETVVRENLGKTHPELLKAAMADEAAAVVEGTSEKDAF